MKLHRRPLILGGLASLAGPGALRAQQPAPGKVWRIGVLSESVRREYFDQLPPQLAELGYVEGRNLVIDYKYAQDKPERLPGLAAELLAAKPDLLIGLLTAEAMVLKRATSKIPIVMMYVTAPDELGLVASLARPGGNITGTATNTPELAGKMTQLLRDTVPGMSRLTWLNNPDTPGMALYMNFVRKAGAAMGLRVSFLAVRTLPDLDAAFANLERARPDAIGVATTGVLLSNFDRVIEFAARTRLPALYSIAPAVFLGGLMSYAADFRAMAQRNASMIDRIFKGTKPSDIPVEEPARFQFVINMKTAKAMGLVIPPTVLLQATQVIE